jgi:osmotically-inducible protein OsmY
MNREMLASLKRRSALIIGAVMLGLLVGCAGAGAKTGTYIDDSTVTTKVKSEMLANKDIHSGSIHVETSGGVVHLSGFVPSEAEKHRAVEVAYSVAGVKSVRDGLTVQSQ